MTARDQFTELTLRWHFLIPLSSIEISHARKGEVQEDKIERFDHDGKKVKS